MKNTLLVVSPHPDDETLGAGGYLLKAKVNGWNLHWLILTNVKEDYGWEKTRVTIRNLEIEKVSSAYSFEKVYNLGLEPAGLDKLSNSEILAKITCVIKEVEPHTVIIPWKGDAHTDHKIAFQLMISATKTFRYPSIKKVLSMEILSETNFGELEDFHPNYFVDITDYFEKDL